MCVCVSVVESTLVDVHLSSVVVELTLVDVHLSSVVVE